MSHKTNPTNGKKDYSKIQAEYTRILQALMHTIIAYIDGCYMPGT